MKQTYITIKGKRYLYLEDNDTDELLTSAKGYIWNSYGTTPTDIELDNQENSLNDDEIITSVIKK